MDIEDVDDPMEIDDSVPDAQIIERKSDSFMLPETPITKPPEDVPTSMETQESASENKKDEADVVILDDDDEPTSEKKTTEPNVVENENKPTSPPPSPVKEVIDLVDTHRSNRCLNSSCSGVSTSFIRAPDFCLSYFRVKRLKKRREEICKVCYDISVEGYDKLTTELKSGKLVFAVDYPVMNETLQIEDSDEEEGDCVDDDDCIDEENFKFISENIDEILMKTLSDVDIGNHMIQEQNYLKGELGTIDGNLTDITRNVKEMRNLLDRIQLDLYNQFRPDVRALRGLTIVDDFTHSLSTIVKVDQIVEARKSSRPHKPVSYVELDDPGNSNSPKVNGTPTEEKPAEVPKDLPPVDTINLPALTIGEIYYISRSVGASNWVRARLQKSIAANEEYNGVLYSEPCYKLVELKQQKERIVDGKNIAYMNPCPVRLPVGRRIISMFKEPTLNDDKKVRHNLFYAGIVAEPPFEGNRYRYLIFFDIGYSQYVSYQDVHLIMQSSENVWDDMPADTRPFIEKYLKSQDRPMVKLTKDQTIKTEYNGKWRLCTVKNVDCALVQVFFESLNRMEWIYRGSTRLSPMFREEQAATNRQTGHRTTSRKLAPNESATVVQYTRNNDLVEAPKELPPPPTSSVRAVARKSTTRPQGNLPPTTIVPFLPQVSNLPINVNGPTSKIMYFTPRDQIITKRVYKPHNCSSKCRELLLHPLGKMRGHNPLSKPLLCGFARLTLKSKGKKEIIYKAPCGRMLRNIAEVHYYLQLTKSEMTVDLFDFNNMVRCLAEFSVECMPDPKDLSNAKEQVPIPVINGISNEMLDFVNYSNKRMPMDDVHLNLDPEFLCGCDCDDDCIDKTKCSCWKLTMEGVKYLGKDVDPNSVGYIYRRLPEQVITGIYECNSRCKCSSTCLNRVVQNPMSLKLQVFKTHNRGWGIRCLNDVPQGSFICIYAGTIHTEQMANADGMAFGDEYFAELDYIEVVERYKEDYEKEAFEDDVYKTNKSPHNSPDEDEEEERTSSKQFKKYMEDNDFVPTIALPSDVDSSGIRTRLRKRNDDDGVKVKQEDGSRINIKAALETLPGKIDTVTISDDEDEGREVLSFNPKSGSDLDENKGTEYSSVRDLFGEDESVYVMDAKNSGNIGRFLNHSCAPNVFVQNVFVDTQDPRFPWVAFFSSQFIRAGTELTWNYNYDIGSVPGRVLYCHCAALECKGRLL